MLTLLLAAAQAADVAVLPFDGYGVPYDEVQLAPQGFRDALLESGAHSPLSEYEVTNRLSVGHEEQIAEARRLVAQARTSLDKGEPRAALSTLTQALELHEQADSAWARRPELADVHYFTGTALLSTGRRTEAITSFVEALYLFPGYAETRAPTMTPAISAALEDAEAVLDEADPRRPAPGDLSRLGEALDVDLIVTGYVDLAGTVFVQMTADGRVVGESSRSMMVVPPYPGEPIYLDMVDEMLGGLPATSEPTETDQPTDEYYAITTPEALGPDRKPLFAKEPAEDELGTISGDRKRTPRGKTRDKRVTEEWWFWTLGGVAVAGGIGGLVYMNTADGNPEQPDTVEGNDATYTVVVEGP